MKNSILSLLIFLTGQSVFAGAADLRSFICTFTDSADRKVTVVLDVDSSDFGKNKFVGLLSFRIVDANGGVLETEKLHEAVIWKLALNNGRIESVQARFGDGANRAYMGPFEKNESSVQIDLSKDLTGGKIVPAKCGQVQ